MPRRHPWTPPARCRPRAADLSVIEIGRITDMPQLSTLTRGSRRLEPPATSAMVDRLVHAGLVRRTPDPHNHRRVRLTVTVAAQHIISDTDSDTARRLHAVFKSINPQTRRHVIDVLIDTVRQSTK